MFPKWEYYYTLEIERLNMGILMKFNDLQLKVKMIFQDLS